MMRMTRWLNPSPVQVLASFADLNLHPLIAQTLIRRGISDLQAARAFLHAETTTSIPFPNIAPAVERIYSAIRNNERICVWGDFDVDGQSSTSLLVQTLQLIDANVVYYIPIRGKESHGIHIETLKPQIENGVTLLLTCDTGITAYEAIEYANSCGVDVVVTDHHEPGESLPEAMAIINPKLLPEGHLLENLAGVGVAYKLAEALLANYRPPLNPDILLDLVALGLVADVALLKGETRTLVQKGLGALRKTNRIGLKVMAELSGTNLETLTEETIGFTFAPRLNAMGRLSDANPAVELLTTNDNARARVLATQIEGLNIQRRLLTSQIYEAAETLLRESPQLLTEPAIVLSHLNWPGGVIGIVANRLVERYHKPAILLTEAEDGILRGSARSVEGLHITDAIATQKNLLLGFGGHPMAAGLSMLAGQLPSFRKGFSRAVEQQLGSMTRAEPTLQIDAWLKFDEINLDLASALEALAPFGAGNPSLTLATRNVKMKSVTTIGKTREHLKLRVEDESGNVQDILWWGGAGEELPEEGSTFDIAYSLRASTFRGERQVSLQFEEFKVDKSSIEVEPAPLEIVDLRSQPATLNLQPATLIWAEGADKAKGKSRYELHQADELTIYTAPPSPQELRAALEIVKPKRIDVIGVVPHVERTDEFLARLAGLSKFVINQRAGKVTARELAGVTGQREGAVQIGLEWLAAGGHISIERHAAQETYLLSRGSGATNQYLQQELYIAVKGILEETASYRAHFRRANLQSIFNQRAY
jgi:single-stranded-DNA-specific exonuclease